jgi:hypothetical protein
MTIFSPPPNGCVTNPFHVTGDSEPPDAQITAQVSNTLGRDIYYGQPSPQPGSGWDFEFNNVPVGDYTLTISGGSAPDQETIKVRASCQ